MGCGDTKGNFHLHHILPRRDFPHLTFAINNGITLCRECHEKTMGKEYEFIALIEKVANSEKPLPNSEVTPNQAEGDSLRACVETMGNLRKEKYSPTLRRKSEITDEFTRTRSEKNLFRPI